MKIKTRLGDLLGIHMPIIQGGLAYLARAELAAAVSNAGGLGQITAITLGTKDDLANEIRTYRSISKRPFAVNIALGRMPVDDFLDVVIDEHVPVVSLTAGNPEPIMAKLKNYPIKIVVLVSTPRQAIKAEKLGASAVIVVGMEGGGHIGRDDIGSTVLTQEVVNTVGIPVIASGGFMTGQQITSALTMGADGVELGTRFVATKECPAHKNYKQALVKATVLDTVVIDRSIGMPARVLKTKFTLGILEKEKEGVAFEDLFPLISGETNKKAALEGNLDEGFVWASQGVGLIRDIPTVKELFLRFKKEIEASTKRLMEHIEI